ncbi:Bifunctional dihydroflavonol 4-reductase/flavanone 4-reductase [Hordeum vulgare]|nr:Bifunctional dihydroflavonol 4-reductase/flavanone 4-reductase [Hordeum vulgare]
MGLPSMMTEADTCRLRRKNAKALRLTIEKSERGTKDAAEEVYRYAEPKRQQDRAARPLKELNVLSDFDSDDGDDHSSTSDDGDQDPLPARDAYSRAGDPKCKGSVHKW